MNGLGNHFFTAIQKLRNYGQTCSFECVGVQVVVVSPVAAADGKSEVVANRESVSWKVSG